MKGIIRKRIEKLERQIPQKSKRKQELSFSLHGAHPSKKEEAIAFRNLKKVVIEQNPQGGENKFVFFKKLGGEETENGEHQMD